MQWKILNVTKPSKPISNTNPAYVGCFFFYSTDYFQSYSSPFNSLGTSIRFLLLSKANLSNYIYRTRDQCCLNIQTANFCTITSPHSIAILGNCPKEIFFMTAELFTAYKCTKHSEVAWHFMDVTLICGIILKIRRILL